MNEEAPTYKIFVIIRIVITLIWVLMSLYIYKYSSLATKSFINCIIIVDLFTWIVYHLLIAQDIVKLNIIGIVNLILMIFMLKNAYSIWPQTTEWKAMLIFVFIGFGGVKAFFYFLRELDNEMPKY